MLTVEVETPKAVALNVVFGNGKAVNVPGGRKGSYTLTGDELGRVIASLDEGRRAAKRAGAYDHEVVGGGCKVKDKGYGDVPEGSKKEKLLKYGHALPDTPDLAQSPPDDASRLITEKDARIKDLEARLAAAEANASKASSSTPSASATVSAEASGGSATSDGDDDSGEDTEESTQASHTNKPDAGISPRRARRGGSNQ